LESRRRPQLLQGEVALLGQQDPYPALVSPDNHRLAPTKPMPWSDIASAPTLLEELLDHAEGDAETVGNFGTSALVVVIGTNNSFTEIQGECSHEQTLPQLPQYGYTIC
jgi:hypothetical protein